MMSNELLNGLSVVLVVAGIGLLIICINVGRPRPKPPAKIYDAERLRFVTKKRTVRKYRKPSKPDVKPKGPK